MELGLGLAILMSVVVAANGVTRFDLLQSALGALGLCAALISAVVGVGRTSRVPSTAVFLLAAAAAYAVGSAGVAAHGEAWDEAVRWVSLCAAATVGAVVALPASRLLVSLSAAALIAGACSVAQSFGADFPPGIPFVTPGAFGRGTFDDPGAAAAWFALALPMLAGWDWGARRWLVGAGVVAAAVGLGLSGSWYCVALGAIGCLFAARRRSALLGAALAVLVASGVAGFGPERVEGPPERAQNALMETGADPAYSAPGAAGFFLAAAKSYAASNQPFGAGPGGFPGRAMEHADGDDPFALAHYSGVPVPRHAPSPLLELAGDYGLFVPLAFVLAALLGGVRSWRARRWGTLGGCVVALGLMIGATGVFSGASFILVGVVIGSASSWSSDAAGAGAAKWLMRLVAASCLATLVHHVPAVTWSYRSAASVVHLGHGRLADGGAWAERAAATQKRFASELNAAVARYVGPDRDLAGALEHLEEAVRIRRYSVPARAQLADLYIRSSFGSEDSEARLARARRMFDVLVALEPNNVDLAMARANASLALFDHAGAVAALEAIAARPIPEAEKVRVFRRLGQAHEDANDPSSARSAYRRALSLVGEGPARRELEEKIDAMGDWVETGVRPRAGHEGH